ncbi:MAG: hypothetical protein J6T24_00560 [Clostridia bacterium]|nr:hypothetical protein [Clostridia bacterium]
MRSRKISLIAFGLLACMLISLGLTSCGGATTLADEDMKKYISLNESDYKGVVVTIPAVDEVTDQDVEDYIYNIRLQNATKVEKDDGVIQKDDTVKIWYRGEVNVDGVWVDFVGGSNLFSTIYSLVIGSGSFIDGFEDAMIGHEITDSKLVTITDITNKVGENGLPIVYVSYNYAYTENAGTDSEKVKKGTFTDRIDLRKGEDGNYLVAGRYDESTLREDLLGKNIGDMLLKSTYTENFDITGDLKEETLTITNVQVLAIVKEDTPLVFEVPFPDPYANNAELAGKNVRWYVYADTISRPGTLPEITKTFITKNLNITYENILPLVKEEDANLSEEELLKLYYRQYIKEGLEDQREATIEQNAITALWEIIAEKVQVTAWPETVVENYITQLEAQAKSAFESYSQENGNTLIKTWQEYVVNNYDGEYFPNVDSIACGFRRMAEETLRQQMALYYIADVENLKMSKKEQDEGYANRIKLMIDYYNAMYGIESGSSQSFTEADMNSAGYTKEVIVEDLLYEKVSLKLYETMKDKIVFESASAEEEAE